MSFYTQNERKSAQTRFVFFGVPLRFLGVISAFAICLNSEVHAQSFDFEAESIEFSSQGLQFQNLSLQSETTSGQAVTCNVINENWRCQSLTLSGTHGTLQVNTAEFSNQSWLLHDLQMTLCEGALCDAPWSIEAQRAEEKNGDLLLIWPHINLFGFHTPSIPSWTLKNQRSGAQFPRLGYTSHHGMRIEWPFLLDFSEFGVTQNDFKVLLLPGYHGGATAGFQVYLEENHSHLDTKLLLTPDGNLISGSTFLPLGSFHFVSAGTFATDRNIWANQSHNIADRERLFTTRELVFAFDRSFIFAGAYLAQASDFSVLSHEQLLIPKAKLQLHTDTFAIELQAAYIHRSSNDHSAARAKALFEKRFYFGPLQFTPHISGEIDLGDELNSQSSFHNVCESAQTQLTAAMALQKRFRDMTHRLTFEVFGQLDAQHNPDAPENLENSQSKNALAAVAVRNELRSRANRKIELTLEQGIDPFDVSDFKNHSRLVLNASYDLFQLQSEVSKPFSYLYFNLNNSSDISLHLNTVSIHSPELKYLRKISLLPWTYNIFDGYAANAEITFPAFIKELQFSLGAYGQFDEKSSKDSFNLGESVQIRYQSPKNCFDLSLSYLYHRDASSIWFSISL